MKMNWIQKIYQKLMKPWMIYKNIWNLFMFNYYSCYCRLLNYGFYLSKFSLISIFGENYIIYNIQDVRFEKDSLENGKYLTKSF